MDRWLAHYGVRGQKKGQRRYQYEDGTWTELGKKRRRFGNAKKTYSSTENPDSLEGAAKKANDIYNTWTRQEKEWFDAETYTDDNEPDKWIDQEWIDYYYRQQKGVRYMNVTEIKDVPVSFITMLQNDDLKEDSIGIGVRNDPEYRQVGAAYQEGKRAVKYWFEHEGNDILYWTPKSENIGSRKTAEKLGFKLKEDQPDDGWSRYVLYRDQGKEWLKKNGFL